MKTLKTQLAVLSTVFVVLFGWQTWQAPSFQDLWMTADQQGRLLYESLAFAEAAETFESPSWSAVASYEAGQYDAAAGAFAMTANAEAAYNRGNALMKARKYGPAGDAYQLAVNEAPDWDEAADNLALARYVRDYIERAREQGDTGDDTELSADGFEFDNRDRRGREMTISSDSVMEAASAEKWMRSVNTETREFLQMRFALEAALGEGGQP